MAIVLVLSPFFLGSTRQPALSFVEISALICIFLWVIKMVIDGELKFVNLRVNIPIAMFLIMLLIQQRFIHYFIPHINLGPFYPYRMLNSNIKFFTYILFFYIVLNNFQKRNRIERLVKVLVFTGFLVSLFGIIQKISNAERIYWTIVIPKGDVFFASFMNRNHFANYINMHIFITLGIVFSRLPYTRYLPRHTSKSSLFKILLLILQRGIGIYIFSLVVMVTALFYSLSRGGILSFTVGIGVFTSLLIMKGLTKKGYIAILILIVIVFGMLIWIGAPSQILERFFTSENLDKESPILERIFGARYYMTKSTFPLIRDYPFLGVGLGMFRYIYNLGYKPKSLMPYYIDHIHNDIVEPIAETGLLGGFLIFMGIYLYLAFIIKTLKQAKDPFRIAMTSGALSALFSMCFHSLFSFNFRITSNVVLFFVICAVGLISCSSRIRNGKSYTTLPLKSFSIFKKGFYRSIVVIFCFIIFIHFYSFIIRPCTAHLISHKKEVSVSDIKKAVALEPLNERYRILLAELYIKNAPGNKENLLLALQEVKEAIKINPCEEYYIEFLNWIIKELCSKG